MPMPRKKIAPPKALTFQIGDKVSWSSQAAGGWRTKTGHVVEIVPPGKSPRRGDYFGSRRHTWYVVDVDGVIYHPVASKLSKATKSAKVGCV